MKIAFGYKKGSGKDTCVNYLINKYDGVVCSFSEPLYNILFYAQKMCGFNIEKDRFFLQNVGTNWARNKDKNVWVKLLLEKIKNIKPSKNIYINDVRFINEYTALKKEGFLCIKINRNIEGEIDKHISENELDVLEDNKWDYIIDNNNSIEELYKKLDDIIFKIIE